MDIISNVTSCPTERTQSFTLYPEGLEERVEVEIEHVCDCDCQLAPEAVRNFLWFYTCTRREEHEFIFCQYNWNKYQIFAKGCLPTYWINGNNLKYHFYPFCLNSETENLTFLCLKKIVPCVKGWKHLNKRCNWLFYKKETYIKWCLSNSDIDNPNASPFGQILLGTDFSKKLLPDSGSSVYTTNFHYAFKVVSRFRLMVSCTVNLSKYFHNHMKLCKIAKKEKQNQENIVFCVLHLDH